MNVFFTDKIKMLEDYIEKLETVVANDDTAAAKVLQNEVISVYDHEIDGLKTGLDKGAG